MTKKPLSKKPFFLFITIFLVAAFTPGVIALKNKLFPSCIKGAINGQKISCEEFDKTTQKQTVTLKMQYGKLFDQFLPLLKMKDRAWQQLQLLSAAKKEHIRVANQEVVNEIAKFDIFFRGDKFDKASYRYFLRSSLNTTSNIFEDAIRDSLTIQKLFDKVTSSANVTDEEILKTYKKENEKIQADYISIPLETKTDITVDDAKLQEYFNQHQKDFFIPTSIKVEYIELDFPADGGIQKQVEMKYKAKAIMDFYAKSKNLSAAAATMQFTLKESDYFHLENFNAQFPKWPLTFIMEVLEMDKNIVKEPYKIEEKGYVIVRLKNRKAGYTPTLAEVKDVVKRMYIRDINKQDTIAKATTIYEQLKTLNTKDLFTTTVKSIGFEANDSGEVFKQQLILTHDIDDASQADIINATQINTVSTPIVCTDHVLILFVNKFTGIEPTQFEKDKKSFTEQLLQVKKEKIFAEYTEKLSDTVRRNE